ncbi:MAG: outer membrane protein [Xanthobacteraceae bacterium]|jgi:outer membrane immunogenic protein
MRKILASGIGVLALAAAMLPAAAADLARKAPVYKAPPPIIDPWTWTGIYVGLNAGYSWGKSRTTVDYFNTLTGLPVAPPPGSITSVDFNLNGGIAGGQIGANLQTDWVVWGIEADLQWSGQKGSAFFNCLPTFIGIGAPCVPGATALPPGAFGVTLSLDQKLQWFGTLRGRVGVTFAPTVLAYVTGGLAYGEIKTEGTLVNTPAFALPVSTAFSHSVTKTGWTVGAGLEARLWDNWTGKIEYLYMDLGTVSGTIAPPATPPFGLIGANYSSRITDNILRVGLNYKFGPPPVRAAF